MFLRRWSIKTRFTIASAIGTALIPTQGSCLPLISSSTSFPSLSMDVVALLMLDVGLIKKLISISSPFEIPPRIPPELFESNPVLVISSLSSDPLEMESCQSYQ